MMSRVALGFDDGDSGSEDEVQQKPVARRFGGKSFGKVRPRTNKDLLAESLQNQIKAQEYEAKDPEAYQYDEVYDEIQSARESKKPKPVNDQNGSKYIDRLLEAKKKRNLDKLHLQDLKQQKERELEGDEFKDKEVFITKSYKNFKDQRIKEQLELEKGINNDINTFRDNITNNNQNQNQTNQDSTDQNESTNNTEIIYTSSFLNNMNQQQQSTNNNNNDDDDDDDEGNNNPNNNSNSLPNPHTIESTRFNRDHLIPPLLSDEVIQGYRERYEQRLAERQRLKELESKAKSKFKFKLKK
ncbi:Intersectin-2 [Wickerhamomyces ciferrii]|uniref:Intersectin-2 n=1 Tax=Wickerhamomyces ciferrii (strain ATCC 14091 / BCRC 22168 / CBS 111 / JCM 3599 / NBRC 0793 / NRRL Y-1031 F-60-10) TaxID=1206466 RepID=K0KW06_WICCF|nr:Intersectin-2 [Wickerhamomyces ciferrii]CCH45303.1 Intersectin-2 [Wickerhamomyces ciferrii]